jgi:uncharacterized DUF497 family protein
MIFEWDEDKRQAILEDRSLDFADADLFFDGRPVIFMPSRRSSEARWKATLQIETAFFTLVWTWRGEVVRVISMRRAHEGEERAYRALHG